MPADDRFLSGPISHESHDSVLDGHTEKQLGRVPPVAASADRTGVDFVIDDRVPRGGDFASDGRFAILAIGPERNPPELCIPREQIGTRGRGSVLQAAPFGIARR